MDEELVLEGAADPIDVPEVVDRRPARVYARLQGLDHRSVQARVFLSREASGGTHGVHTRAVQRLVGIDVAHAGQPPLIE